MTSTRTKILLHGKHIAYIDTDFLKLFQSACGVINYAAWVRKLCYHEFNLMITNKEDIEQLTQYIHQHYYDSIGEWIREHMRKALKKALSA